CFFKIELAQVKQLIVFFELQIDKFILLKTISSFLFVTASVFQMKFKKLFIIAHRHFSFFRNNGIILQAVGLLIDQNIMKGTFIVIFFIHEYREPLETIIKHAIF